MKDMLEILAGELSRPVEQIERVVALLDEGNTIPFIARYRKEMHGSMDDTQLRHLEERLQYLRRLDVRREEIRRAIEGQEKLTEELAAALDAAQTQVELEDIYRPFKQKRRTRASMAKEKGLEPLAALLYAQARDVGRPEDLAAAYCDAALGVESVADALAGASDIVAEWIAEDAALRAKLRALALRQAVLTVRAVEEKDSVYRLYYDFTQPINRLQGHQVLAINRGEREGALKVSLTLPQDRALELLRRAIVVPGTAAMAFIRAAVEDAYGRLLLPSLERELRAALTDSADEGGISLFAKNLKSLLLQPPVKGKVTLGLDPGYRTGCKIAVVDPTGKLLDTAVIYPTPPHNKIDEAKTVLRRLFQKHQVALIAIGNGTASRESEQLVAELLSEEPGQRAYAMVNEAGASVYSASKLAAEEFPDYDVSLRSAVSIARRLQDPLAELVKIDPQSIGVGQYQHDMPQKRLGEALDAVVEDCVNAVGVDLNTASVSLLSRVAGLNASTAKSIVAYREEQGAFRSRAQLRKVPKLGAKRFEQCAGFLRLPESSLLFERTGVHPESYAAAEALLTICGYDPKSHVGAVEDLSERVSEVGMERVLAFCAVGLPTLRDIMAELQKPGRDIREDLDAPLLRTDVMYIKDLKPGMQLRGTVRNVIDFGAFVDIGVHQDGLVHISEISPTRLRHPSERLSVGDVVPVVVLDVDVEKKRISLSIKQADATQ